MASQQLINSLDMLAKEAGVSRSEVVRLFGSMPNKHQSYIIQTSAGVKQFLELVSEGYESQHALELVTKAFDASSQEAAQVAHSFFDSVVALGATNAEEIVDMVWRNLHTYLAALGELNPSNASLKPQQGTGYSQYQEAMTPSEYKAVKQLEQEAKNGSVSAAYYLGVLKNKGQRIEVDERGVMEQEAELLKARYPSQFAHLSTSEIIKKLTS